MQTSYIKKVVVFYKELPTRAKHTLWIYLSSVITYNTTSAYLDGKKYLMAYRQNTLTPTEQNYCKSEWSAVKYGINKDMCLRFFKSLIWPLSVTSDIIPFVVLALNKENKEDSGNKENK